MKKNKFVFLIVLIVVLVTSCNKEDSPTEPSEFGEISGVITNQTDNTPIAKASVYTKPATSVISTDESGQFRITTVEPGLYQVTAVKNGFDSLVVGVTVSAGATAVADFILPVADSLGNQEYGIISGTIYDALSGNVITSVNLSTDPSTSSIRSGADGQFEFSNLLPGEYTVSAEKNGYISGSKIVKVTAGFTTQSIIELMPEDTTTVEVKGNLIGKIINSVTETPIKNVLVSTDPSFGSVLTDSAGNYKIEDLPVGEYDVNVNKVNFSDGSATVSIVGGKNTSANFSLTPSVGSVEGEVVDSLGNPLNLVEITTDPETSSFVTNSEGKFIINNIAVGDLTITAEKQNYTAKSVDIIVEAGKTTEIVIVLYKN